MPPKLKCLFSNIPKKTDFPRFCEACYMYWHSRYISDAIHFSSWSYHHTAIIQLPPTFATNPHKSDFVPSIFPHLLSLPRSFAGYPRWFTSFEVPKIGFARLKAEQNPTRASGEANVGWHSPLKMASSTAIQPWGSKKPLTSKPVWGKPPPSQANLFGEKSSRQHIDHSHPNLFFQKESKNQ